MGCAGNRDRIATPRSPRSLEVATWELMSRNGVGSSVPFWYTRTTPPLSVTNIRPSGAKAMPVANGRLLATTSSTKPDGVKVMIASDRCGVPSTTRAASRPATHASARLRAARGTSTARQIRLDTHSGTSFSFGIDSSLSSKNLWTPRTLPASLPSPHRDALTSVFGSFRPGLFPETVPTARMDPLGGPAFHAVQQAPVPAEGLNEWLPEPAHACHRLPCRHRATRGNRQARAWTPGGPSGTSACHRQPVTARRYERARPARSRAQPRSGDFDHASRCRTRPSARSVGRACALYVLLHLVTIGRSHIPWFDDTFFASIADTLGGPASSSWPSRRCGSSSRSTCTARSTSCSSPASSPGSGSACSSIVCRA